VVIVGDIVIAINGVRITGIDSLSANLEEYTLPGKIIDLMIIRNNKTTVIQLEIERRPATSTI
jgi:S1-C subfamily serine protease